jgi:nicotinate phosphoribosyltransferase
VSLRALFTDLYQLTMAAGYWQSGKTNETACFELFVRRLPPRRDFLVCCGLDQAIEYLSELRFDERQIRYLQGLPQFQLVESGFWDYLREFRFRGDIDAVPEGTVVFPGEPLLHVRAPLIEAQIPETYLLATLGFQTLIASKAARILAAAEGRMVVEFGCRRAHAPEAGCLAARAAFLAGCAGSSNVEAGFRFAVPVFGTAAHSWVLSFESEREAFSRLQHLLGDKTVQLIDSFDTLEGARIAASQGKPLWGVRLDSGDLLALSKEVRAILNAAGLTGVKIMATNDLDEDTIGVLVRAGAPIDVYGVGTSLATSFDAPALSCVYKLVEMEGAAGPRFPYKKSEGKRTLPGRKQINRFPDYDLVSLASEARPEAATPLLGKVMQNGEVLVAEKNVRRIQEYARAQISAFGLPGRRVVYSPALLRLAGLEA